MAGEGLYYASASEKHFKHSCRLKPALDYFLQQVLRNRLVGLNRLAQILQHALRTFSVTAFDQLNRNRLLPHSLYTCLVVAKYKSILRPLMAEPVSATTA